MLGLADRLRPDARATVAALAALTGSIPILFTGDNPRAAAGLAAEGVAAEADAGPLLQTLDARAIENADEHVIKLTEAAEREYRRTKNVTLLVGADRFRDRVPDRLV